MSSADRPVNHIGPYEIVGFLASAAWARCFARPTLARFEREARIVASLDHRHIAAIYGVEEAGGPTLAERLSTAASAGRTTESVWSTPLRAGRCHRSRPSTWAAGGSRGCRRKRPPMDRFSPVEDVIAYVETLPDLGGFVRFMTGDGQPLARGPADATTRLNNGFVRRSPDGKRLAGIGIPGNRSGHVWILDPSGPVPFRKLIELPADAVPRGASWARDGSSIVIGLRQTTGDIILAERSR